MAAPLPVCTKEEESSVIRFLWSEGVSGAEIHRRLSAQYGNSVLRHQSVYEWIGRFKNGRTIVTHESNLARVFHSTVNVMKILYETVFHSILGGI